MNVWGCAEMTGGSAVRKYEERWRRWEQQHAFLNCIKMAASLMEAECHWCSLSNGLSLWHGFQNVRQSSPLIFADIWGCPGYIYKTCTQLPIQLIVKLWSFLA